MPITTIFCCFIIQQSRNDNHKISQYGPAATLLPWLGCSFDFPQKKHRIVNKIINKVNTQPKRIVFEHRIDFQQCTLQCCVGQAAEPYLFNHMQLRAMVFKDVIIINTCKSQKCMFSF